MNWSKFILGFFCPIIGMVLISLIAFVVLLPFVVGYLIEGYSLSWIWGVVEVVWILLIGGLIAGLEKK